MMGSKKKGGNNDPEDCWDCAKDAKRMRFGVNTTLLTWSLEFH
jgi:hypothetical protein